MILAAIIISSCLAYLLIGMWTFGYVAGSDGRWAALKYYYDEFGPWFSGILWPIYWLFKIPQPILVQSWKYAQKVQENQKIRVEIEKRVRIEMEKAEKEVEDLLIAEFSPTHSRSAASSVQRKAAM